MIEKTYIGIVEAWEIAQERKIDQLPEKGWQTITCYSQAAMRPDEILGQDTTGFYIGVIKPLKEISKIIV